MHTSTRLKKLLLATVALPGIALAADNPPGVAPVNLPDVQVVGSTPLLGSGIERDRLPEATNVLAPQDINRTGVPSLTDGVLSTIPGAALTDTSGNPFQPDILFRGFTASPVAGTAQGIAVYVNGARFNDAFGDTVNWDLIPPAAIDSVNVEASNPVFGLNALGGSVNVRLKNGFTDHGGEITAYGGSFNRGAGIIEYGQQAGDVALYFAGDVTHDGGFRQTSESDIYRSYTDLGWRNDKAEIHLGITAASNTLGNPGATPVQALASDLSSIFTAPNTVANKYLSVNINGTYSLTDMISVQGVAYYQNLTQRITNGITEQLAACGDGSGNLCNSDGVTPVTTRGGAIVPDYLNGGLYSGLSLQGLNQNAYGASAQMTEDADILDRHNHLVIGAGFDGSNTVFDAQTQIGGFTADHAFIGPGVTVDQPDYGVNPVRVATTTRYFGIFADNLFSVTPQLDLNIAGRFNTAEIDLADKLGGAVSGQHSYSRFNPSAGLTYHFTPDLAVYGSYAETNRAPTPTELSCASAATPCSLLNFFVGDPNLKQVISRTFEGGLRGHIADIGGGRIGWDADYFRTRSADDLIYEATIDNPNLSFYTNAGKTQRQGAEANLHFDTQRLHVAIGYAYTDATFQSTLTLNSPNNPQADANGQIHIVPGRRIPGIPGHRGTIVVGYKVTDAWTVGSSAILEGDVYRFGDEANLTKPIGGYVVLNLNASYQITDRITLFGLVNNVTNRRYDTYGAFGPVGDVPWLSVPGGVTDTRTASPGAPLAGYGGVRVTF